MINNFIATKIQEKWMKLLVKERHIANFLWLGQYTVRYLRSVKNEHGQVCVVSKTMWIPNNKPLQLVL
ncbi:hypothetical protein P8452_45074 [Trifolium repens]|nr:hypothetical protein P8452_45074 [Trifolium repens]